MSASTYDMRGHYAGFVSRLVAFLIDRGIAAGIIAVVVAVSGYLFNLVGLSVATCTYSPTFAGIVCGAAQLMLGLFALTFAPLYTIIFWTLAGQTPGKYLLGLRIYQMDGHRLTFRRSLRRYVGYWLSAIAFGLGFFWIIIDDERQGFHDKFADTCVVYAWDAFQNQRLINRLSMKIFRSRFLQNPEAFYARGMTVEDTNEELEGD
ncbi:MAG TPA: RDD family protein [Anaerolineae bacterium]|nr:RDD family protein [Anaerolineae bacterium]